MGREGCDRRCGQRRSGYRCAAIDRTRGIAENDRQLVCRGLCSFGSGKRGCKARRKSGWGCKKYENSKIASATSKVKDKTAGLASKAIEKVKASRAASKVASTKKSVNTPAAKSRNIKIKGYTKHGINQAISHDGKGVKPSSIIHAVKYGTAKIQKNGTIRYTSEQASVVLNAMQKVVSAWAKSSKYWRK